MHLHKLVFAAALAAAFTPAAMADDYAGGAVMSMASDLGEILTDANGMTLYIFDKDEPGVSNCYDTCAEKWPPLLASEGAMAEGDFTLVERNDGTMQWAFDGMPLYGWVNDVSPGDTTGDGVGGVWHVVVEDGAM